MLDMDTRTYIPAREIRKAAGLSMEKLARLADISTSTVTRFEQGQNIGAAKVQRIASALGCSLDALYEEAS